MKKPPMKGKYTEKSDKKMDAYLTRDLDKEEKEEFKKLLKEIQKTMKGAEGEECKEPSFGNVSLGCFSTNKHPIPSTPPSCSGCLSSMKAVLTQVRNLLLKKRNFVDYSQ